MEVPNIVAQKKTIIIEILILAVFLGGGYYAYTALFTGEVTTTEVVSSNAGLGPNFTTYMNAVAKDKISFKEKDVSFLNSSLVRMLVDYSETISPNATRGRLDPFVPYASSRPLR
jgi:hypothetical protein